jgi:hypothetical protein
MQGARAAISCLLAALALSGCMTAITAMQPRGTPPECGEIVQVGELWF